MGQSGEDLKEEVKRVKTFMLAMDWFNLSVEKKRKFLSDKRLSQNEKAILECSLLIRENKFQAIEDRLKKMVIHHPLIEAQRCYVLAIGLNASSRSHEAVDYFIKAKEIFHQFQLERFEYNTLVQLFYAYLNLKHKTHLLKILDELEEFKLESVVDIISIERCRFNSMVFMGDFRKAKISIRKLDELRSQMHQGQMVSFLVDKFIFYLKIENWGDCEKVIEELKQHRHYRLTESFNFMQALFNHLRDDHPLYLYDEQFSKFPLLHYQLKVIQSLSSAEYDKASKYWSKLHELNPEVYQHDLSYCGDICLFSLCLDKHLQAKKTFKNIQIEFSRLSALEKKLMDILRIGPLTKEEIYFRLWNERINEKADLKKLTMIVSRLKRKTGIEIVSEKGCYKLKINNPQNVKFKAS